MCVITIGGSLTKLPTSGCHGNVQLTAECLPSLPQAEVLYLQVIYTEGYMLPIDHIFLRQLRCFGGIKKMH